MPPKILFIADFSLYGGTRTYFNQLMKLYHELGYVVYTGLKPSILKKSGFPPDYPLLIHLPEQYQIHRTSILSGIINQSLYLYYQIYLAIFIWHQVRVKQIDMVAVSTGSCDGYIATLALPIPCLYIIHSTPHRTIRNILHKYFLKVFLSSHNRIIAVSQYMQEEIRKTWGSKKNNLFILVVYHGSKKMIPENCKKPTLEQKTIILTLGHVVWYKNPEMWIQTAEICSKDPIMKNFQWIWAGDGEMLETCRSSVQQKGLSNVLFIGYHEDVHSLYEQAALYFQPSIIESFGLSVLDAMQEGLPCVVTRAGGLPELVIEGESGFLIEENNSMDAAEKIKWLLLHPDEGIRMGENGKNHYINKFTEKHWIDKMTALQFEIMSD